MPTPKKPSKKAAAGARRSDYATKGVKEGVSLSRTKASGDDIYKSRLRTSGEMGTKATNRQRKAYYTGMNVGLTSVKQEAATRARTKPVKQDVAAKSRAKKKSK
jgi:hypothetical protein